MTITDPPHPPRTVPARRRDTHKGDCGRVLLVGGSRGMSGSIALAAMAALRSGSGLVTALVPDRCLETVAGFDPCLMTVAAADDLRGRFALSASAQLSARLGGIDAVGIGPGMATGAGSLQLVRMLAAAVQLPRVFDADALNLIATTDGLDVRGPAVLTPHPGEMQRLCGVSAKDRPGQIEAAAEWARAHGLVMLLKGADTLVTDGQLQWVNPTGNPGMASGGSGDCLTGVIAALLGMGLSPWDAARLGAYLHGLAGDLAAAARGGPGMTARDLLDQIAAAVRRCTAASDAAT